MFRATPNNYNELPLWSTMPMIFPRQIMPNPMMPVPIAQVPVTSVPQVLPPGTTGEADFEFEPGPPVQDDINYTQGYLKTKIGSYIKIEFLIGTNMLIDREGILEKVGISYVVIREAGTNDELMCDIYSIKFVRIFDNQAKVTLCMK